MTNDIHEQVQASIQPQIDELDHMRLDLLSPQPNGKHRADDQW